MSLLHCQERCLQCIPQVAHSWKQECKLRERPSTGRQPAQSASPGYDGDCSRVDLSIASHLFFPVTPIPATCAGVFLSWFVRRASPVVKRPQPSPDNEDGIEIPYIDHEVEKKHFPKQIECLLIAESPPPTGYFYSPGFPSKRGGLRYELFKTLKVQDDEDALTTFSERGFLLIDAVKLRIRSKEARKSLLGITWRRKKLVDASARLMERELAELRFAPSGVVWLIGKTARDTFVEVFKHLGERGCQRLRDCQLNWQDSLLPTFIVSAYDVRLSRMPFFRRKEDGLIWNHQSKLILEHLQYRYL